MRIAIYSDTFTPLVNGVANVVNGTAKALAERGHDVCIVALSKRQKGDHRYNLNKNIQVINLPSIPFWAYSGERFSIPFGLSMQKIRKFKPQILHSHTPFVAGWEAVFASKLFDIPLIGTHHTYYDQYLKHVKLDYEWMRKFSWRYTDFYYNQCKLVLSPSRSLANDLIKTGLKRPVKIMPNPVNTDLFFPIPDKGELKKKYGINGKSIAYMGRLSYEKNIDLVLMAFMMIHKALPDSKLMIIGDGPERESLNQRASELGIKNNLIFTGYLFGEELNSALNANDIFVTASKSENMPLSVLEAMASGLPVVGFPAYGLTELIINGENGYHARVDDIEDLAGKCLSILTEGQINEFSRRARDYALRYSYENKINELEQIYQKLIRH